jgi:hypothetical protein
VPSPVFPVSPVVQCSSREHDELPALSTLALRPPRPLRFSLLGTRWTPDTDRSRQSIYRRGHRGHGEQPCSPQCPPVSPVVQCSSREHDELPALSTLGLRPPRPLRFSLVGTRWTPDTDRSRKSIYRRGHRGHGGTTVQSQCPPFPPWFNALRKSMKNSRHPPGRLRDLCVSVLPGPMDVLDRGGAPVYPLKSPFHPPCRATNPWSTS